MTIRRIMMRGGATSVLAAVAIGAMATLPASASADPYRVSDDQMYAQWSTPSLSLDLNENGFADEGDLLGFAFEYNTLNLDSGPYYFQVDNPQNLSLSQSDGYISGPDPAVQIFVSVGVTAADVSRGYVEISGLGVTAESAMAPLEANLEPMTLSSLVLPTSPRYDHFLPKLPIDVRVIPLEPTFIDPCGPDNGEYSNTPPQEGVIWSLTKLPGTAAVATAHPALGYSFPEGDFRWSREDSGVACGSEPGPTPSGSSEGGFNPTEEDLTAETEGLIQVCDADGAPVTKVTHGDVVTVRSDCGDVTDTQFSGAVLVFSEPMTLGINSRTVTIPETLPAGTHRIAVYGDQGQMVGWQTVEVSATGVATVTDSSSDTDAVVDANVGAGDVLASTGYADKGQALTALAMLIAGAFAIAGAAVIRRRAGSAI